MHETHACPVNKYTRTGICSCAVAAENMILCISYHGLNKYANPFEDLLLFSQSQFSLLGRG